MHHQREQVTSGLPRSVQRPAGPGQASPLCRVGRAGSGRAPGQLPAEKGEATATDIQPSIKPAPPPARAEGCVRWAPGSSSGPGPAPIPPRAEGKPPSVCPATKILKFAVHQPLRPLSVMLRRPPPISTALKPNTTAQERKT